MDGLPAAGATVAADDDNDAAGRRYAQWFHELDAWTEYWDVFHPETRGRYYFGDDANEGGLLSRFLPRSGRPPPWNAWTSMALAARDAQGPEVAHAFARSVQVAPVRDAILEVDALIEQLFAAHYGHAANAAVQRDYLEAIHRFAIDSLPAATARNALIAADDPRKSTAGRHTLEGDVMWFAWALQIEAARVLLSGKRDVAGDARRALSLAGVATGCAAQFAWRGHRRTRMEYRQDAITAQLLRERGLRWAADADAAADEVHALYRIREFGDEA
jgi:hypothetical protein